MPETVLLVEDDPSLRRLVERLLAKLGYTVIVATGAIEQDLLTRRADFLQKPFSTEQFAAKIREVLGSGL